MSKPVIYISGPMSSIPFWNVPAFNAAADALRKLGYPVVNPADFGTDPKYDWRACMARDLAILPWCDVIALLPGWYDSKGASLEFNTADSLGMHGVTVERILSGGVTFTRSANDQWLIEFN